MKQLFNSTIAAVLFITYALTNHSFMRLKQIYE